MRNNDEEIPKKILLLQLDGEGREESRGYGDWIE